MLLTGKAKKDFNYWRFEVLKDKRDFISIHNDRVIKSLIIEWFDSVGIYINIFHDFNGRFFFNIDNEDSTIKSNFGTSNYNNRIECTRKSIEHANELYNQRNNNQD